MPKRWTQRPPGSTWGDWGDDDELGRINLLTAGEGARRGCARSQAGRSFCLSLPLDYPGRHGAQPAAPPASARAHRGHERQARRLLQRPDERDAGLGRPEIRRRLGGRRRHALAAVLHPVGFARPRRRRVRRRRRRCRGSGLLQRLPGGNRPGRARRTTPPATAAGHRCFAHHLGLEHMAFHGVQGRGVLVDLHHHLGDEWTPGEPASCCRRSWPPTAWSSSRATCCCCTPASPPASSSGTASPTRASCSPPASYLDARDEALLDWIADSQISALVADNYAVEGLLGKDRDPEPALLPADPPPVPVQARGAAGGDVVPARARGVAARARPQPVPADRAAAAAARNRRLAATTPIATV